MLSGWRVADPAFATTPEEMLSGEGAHLYGGRWNSKGVRVVYLGSSLAQAAMELLIYLGRADILNTFHKIEVSFEESFVQHILLEDLPPDWSVPSMASSVKAVGDDWVADQTSLILQVPSAAVKGEYNYLFNPAHPDAGAAIYGPMTPFDYDTRLLDD